MSISSRWLLQAPVFIIAEMSANHGGDFGRAVELLRAAKAAGADAVKLQTYTADTMTIDCDNEYFRIKGTLWEGRTLHDLYREAFTPWDWQPRLKAAAEEMGLVLFSTPFDATAVDFLEAMGVPCHKIASFENGDLPLIRKVAATGKPVIMSTGMASLAELDEAVRTFRQAGGKELALLKCTSAYPAPPEEMHLKTIPYLAARYGVPVGLSDHTLGIAAPIAAVALGACIIEKHFCLDRGVPGPDSAFSLEPAEFKAMVDAVRDVEQALGHVCFELTEKQKASAAYRRSLFVVQDVAAEELFTEANVRAIRPGHGLHTRHLEEVLGKRAAQGIARGTPLGWEHLQGADARPRARLYTAAVCGLGRIGCFFGRSAGGNALCHAAALADHPRVRLTGGCDPAPENRQGFEAAYGVRSFTSLEEMLDALSPDIVSICSPTALHQEQALACIRRRVPMIWLEKPPAGDLAGLELLRVEQTKQGNRSVVLVNYQRRYAACFLRMREALRAQSLGRPVRLSMQYSRGLALNGVHLLDLAFFLVGDEAGCKVAWVDASASATSPSFGLRFADGLHAVFQGDELPYHNIDVSVLCEAGRLSILHGGLTTQVERRVEHELYPGFYRLAPSGEDLLGPSGLDGSFANALEDLLAARERGIEPQSSLATAQRSQEILEQVLGETSA